MDRWTEIRSAYFVAKLGTVSAAAEKLRLHRATVMRHIDALEDELSAKLFQRHRHGYTPTDFGTGLFDLAARAETSFADFQGRMEGQSNAASGNLIVTSTEMLLSTFAPVLKQYQLDNPDVRVKYVISERVARLEVGQAHIAIRSGPYKNMDDTVMLPLASVRSALYAHESYVEQFGRPADLADFRNHRFVSRVLGQEKFPPFQWLRDRIEPKNVVFMSNDMNAKMSAILEGIGIGFLPIEKARVFPNMIEIVPSNPEWDVNFWLVTHVDIHRMPKIQALVSTFRKMGFLKDGRDFADILPPRSVY